MLARVLAIAVREFPEAASVPSSVEETEQQLTLLAVVGIQDPLRADVPAAISQCERAGITVRMLTGEACWGMGLGPWSIWPFSISFPGGWAPHNTFL